MIFPLLQWFCWQCVSMRIHKAHFISLVSSCLIHWHIFTLFAFFFFCLCFTLRNRRGNSAGNQNSCHLIRYIARFNQRIFFMHVFVLLSSRLWVRYVWMFTHPLAVKLLSGVQCSLWPTLLSGGFGCCESSLALCNLFKRCLKIMFPGCKRK